MDADKAIEELSKMFQNAKAFPSSEALAFKHDQIGAVVLTKDGIILYPMGKGPSLPAPAVLAPVQAPVPAPAQVNNEAEALKTELAKVKESLSQKDEEIKRLSAPVPPASVPAPAQAQEDLSKQDKPDGAKALRGFFAHEMAKRKATQ